MLSLDKFHQHFYNVDAPIYFKNKHKHKNIKATHYDTLFQAIYHTLHCSDPFYKYNELLEKIKLLELLEPLTIKYKSKIVDDLNNKNISLYSVMFISNIFKKNIIWYTSKCYVKFLPNNEETIYIFIDKVTEEVNVDTLYEISNIDKPIKSISAYKLDELVQLATDLKITIEVKRKKDIYESIYDYFKELKLI